MQNLRGDRERLRGLAATKLNHFIRGGDMASTIFKTRWDLLDVIRVRFWEGFLHGGSWFPHLCGGCYWSFLFLRIVFCFLLLRKLTHRKRNKGALKWHWRQISIFVRWKFTKTKNKKSYLLNDFHCNWLWSFADAIIRS